MVLISGVGKENGFIEKIWGGKTVPPGIYTYAHLDNKAGLLMWDKFKMG